MARSKKTPVQAVEPSKEETAALYVLMYDSSLFQCHPVVVDNVRGGVEALLLLLKRPDLADLWSDAEKLSNAAAQVS